MQTRRLVLAATIFLMAFPLRIAPASPDALTPLAHKLAAFYDRLGVEDHWIAGQHVDWESGDPDGRPERLPGRHTHCSAFAAAAAKRLGIYLLRPPEHGQVLLANAQSEWLAEMGEREGWRALDGPLQAQSAANAGRFVVASYHNHSDDRPGHIAIVRPAEKTAGMIDEEGPDVIQAGSHNATRVSLRQGFAGHPHAWEDAEIAYYAHDVPPGRLDN